MEIIVFLTLFGEEIKEEQTKIDKVVSDGWKYLKSEREIISVKGTDILCKKYSFSKII